MAYAYCQHPGCDSAMSRPSLFEVQYGTWTCLCNGHANRLPRDPTEFLCEFIRDLEERIEALETRIPNQ
jgi:hypothetical protein